MQSSTYAQKTFNGWEWHFKRNCSISPQQLIVIFLSLAVLSLIIGGAFYLLGASLILPFSCLEIVVLSVAFYFNALHAVDFERLRIDANEVIIESKKGKHEHETKLIRGFTRVHALSDRGDLIVLNQGSHEVTFGHHIHPNYRAQVLRELRERL
jgi:uncharacterized membrane protein